MQIDVTAKHIAKATRRNCYMCPVAWAINEKLGSGAYAHVAQHSILLFYKGQIDSRLET